MKKQKTRKIKSIIKDLNFLLGTTTSKTKFTFGRILKKDLLRLEQIILELKNER